MIIKIIYYNANVFLILPLKGIIKQIDIFDSTLGVLIQRVQYFADEKFAFIIDYNLQTQKSTKIIEYKHYIFKSESYKIKETIFNENRTIKVIKNFR